MIPDIRRCRWETYGVGCEAEAIGSDLCEQHSELKCISCGAPATHGCDYCGQFVCGAPLCDRCVGAEDRERASGTWGYLNHYHRRVDGPTREQERREAEELRIISACLGANE